MKNWLTALGGILSSLGLATQGATWIPPEYSWIPNVVAAIGAGLLGLAAKQKNVHSTVDEVEKATIKEVIK